MPKIHMARHLTNQFPVDSSCDAAGQNIAEIIASLDSLFPGIARYILDDRGSLRKHVNIFIGNEFIQDREQLSDVVDEGDEIFIMQALSGG